MLCIGSHLTVEVSIDNGLGYFITGQADESVKESLSRIGVVIRNLGLHMPRTKISVNLSPAEIRKTGPGFDLPIAIGILLASGQAKDRGKLQDYVDKFNHPNRQPFHYSNILSDTDGESNGCPNKYKEMCFVLMFYTKYLFL